MFAKIVHKRPTRSKKNFFFGLTSRIRADFRFVCKSSSRMGIVYEHCLHQNECTCSRQSAMFGWHQITITRQARVGRVASIR